MDVVKIDFSNKIRELRVKNNLTQSDLGRKLGVTKAVVSAYETGLNRPKHEVLFQLSRLFGVTMDYLYSDMEVEDIGKKSISLAGLDRDDIEEIVNLIAHLRAKNCRYDDVTER